MKKIGHDESQYFLGLKTHVPRSLPRACVVSTQAMTESALDRRGKHASAQNHDYLSRKSYEFTICSISRSLYGVTSGKGYFWIFITSGRTTF